LTAGEKHERAREQTLAWLVDAVRRGDYFEAVQWLDTLATVDGRFSLTADEVVAHWRGRASRIRDGVPGTPSEDPRAGDAADYRGLFGALLQHSFDGIVVSAVADGWILECSRSFIALTGYPREELLGRTSLELGLIEPQVREAALAAAAEQRATGGFETRLRRKDGELRWVEFSPQVLAGDELLLTIVRDITHRRREPLRADGETTIGA
jgi:PAS domain S-box-containing protein